jgi:hypothetical protein
MTTCCLFGLLLVTSTVLGCGQQSPPAVAQAQPESAAAPNQTEAAKAHVQQYIDRLLGGDQTVKQGLLGIDGVDFNTIDSVQITSALPSYLPDGPKVENMVRVVLNVRGHDALKRRTIEKHIDLQVRLKDGQWNIHGSNLQPPRQSRECPREL